MPTLALFTRISSRPNRVAAFWTKLQQSLLRRTSATTPAALVWLPKLRSWPRAVFSVAGLRPQINTLAPSRTKASAMLNPMPRAPPVTSATLPSNSTDTPSPFANPALSTNPASAKTLQAVLSRQSQDSLTRSPAFPAECGALQSELANKLLTIEGRAMECVSIDIECGCPLLPLIDAPDKRKSFRIFVDIHFVE